MALTQASFLDVVRFNPVSSGTGSFVVSSAVNGYQTPASAGAINLGIYRYRAESADLTQWEVGYGTYTVSTTTLTRSTILFNSSGGTSAINFALVPQVAIVALAEDLMQLPSFTSGPFNPSGTSSTTLVMMGLGGTCTITPIRTGRLFLEFVGIMFNATALDTTRVQAYFGTGTAPTNPTAVTGTSVGPLLPVASGTSNQSTAFSAGGIITGLTAGTAYWLDIALNVNAGTGTAQSVWCNVFEF